MGLLRTLLAISVVLAHTLGYYMVGGKLAVQLFYLISGFLISFILVENHSYRRVGSFYKNRFLRLFPVYWAVALLTLAMHLGASLLSLDTPFFQPYRELDFWPAFALVFSNIFIVGQDWFMFTGVKNGQFQFIANFQQSEVPVLKGLLVPQAWTLGVEISFYLIAPFVLNRRMWLFALLVASLALRVYLVAIDIGLDDPWDHRFFPTELALFLLGALSHQCLKPLYARRISAQHLGRLSAWVTVALTVYCSVFAWLPFQTLNAWLLVILFIAALPLLFHYQSTNSWDRKVGDLSYPIYISHIMLIYPASFVVQRLYAGMHSQYLIAALVLIGSLLFSVLIDKLISQKIESVRSRVKQAAQ
jgi:peptidoglycan/LPS O-acetylase OafA/YrhL